MLRDMSSPFPLHDADRSDNDEVAFRDVIQELGIPEPYTPDTDSWARVPLRISHNTGAGFVLEVGPYDFSDHDFLALEHAVRELRWLLDANK